MPAILKEAIHSERFLLYLFSLIIGVVVGHAVYGFRELIGTFQTLFYGNDSEEFLVTTVRALPWWQVPLVLTFGGLAVGLWVYFWMPERRNHGVADAIEACALRGGRMSMRAGVGAAVASAASIGMGASVGREGPAIHIGATLGAWLAERLHLSRNLSLTVVGCGVAAAVAASFNAPIAGVFFALEVVIGYYALNAFAPIVIASVSATVVTIIYFGDRPPFLIPDYFLISLVELPFFAVLGVVCGLVATALIIGVSLISRFVTRFPHPAWLRPALGGLAIGLIALAFPQVLGVGYQSNDLALKEGLPLSLMMALVVAKLLATSLALGTGFAGGVFSPAIFLGVMTGGAFGLMVGAWLPEYTSTHGAYAIIGMGGVAAAVLGAPMSTILIIFELTRDYNLTIAVLVTVTIACLLTQYIAPFRSFFIGQLADRGIELGEARERGLLLATTIDNLVSAKFLLIPAATPLSGLGQLLSEHRNHAFIVVDDQGLPVGRLDLADVLSGHVKPGAADIRASDLAVSELPMVLPHTSLNESLRQIGAQEGDFLVVVDDFDRKQINGVVFHKDLLKAHSEALFKAQAEERGDR